MEFQYMMSLTSFFFLLIISTTMAACSDFIRDSCKDTRYPSICYSTLSPHAASIKNSKALLAQTAVSITLKESKAAAAYVMSLKTSAPEYKDFKNELEDCVSNLKDARDMASDSLIQMNEIIKGGGKADPSLGLKVNNVKTWLSAALSSQVTCTDGFEGVADGLVKKEVIKRSGLAEMTTSNALALINKYVNA